jgi:hypothetical protein
MGDKRRKRRPGREADKPTGKPRVFVVRRGAFWVSIDTRTGTLECPGVDGLTRDERDAVTAEVVETLTKYGLPPRCPLEVRDALFG